MIRTLLLTLTVLSFCARVHAADQPLRLVQSIALPGIQGRIDQMTLDSKRNRIYISAMTNNEVGVVDLVEGKFVKKVQSMGQPRGLLYLPDTDILAVASSSHARCFFLNADSLDVVRAVDAKRGANRLRYDKAAKKVYLGYSGAIAIIDAATMSDVGEIPLGAPPETYELERTGKRIFLNLPTLNQIAVIDRETSMITTRWSLPEEYKANFSMALDEANHRLFIICRKPSRLLVFDTETGKIVAIHAVLNDCGDVFYDAANKRIYASCGGGTIDVFSQDTPDQYTLAARIPTAIGARASLFVPELKRFFIVSPGGREDETTLNIYEAVAAAPSTSGPASRPASAPVAPAPSDAASKVTFDFDHADIGTSPPSWKIEGTNQNGPLATWLVIDKTGDARSGRNVLANAPGANASGETFNICWTDTVQFQNGQVEVALKPVTGREDQGGGPMWRIKDKNNYYIARLNPLEKNFRVYIVKDGKRTQLATADTDAPAGQWHTISVTHEGDHITCALDGKQLLDAHDGALKDAGGVGVWTKADAVSSFDSFIVTPSPSGRGPG